MYKHKAIMTDRRYQILLLIAKGYNNRQIAKKMGLTLCNTKLQKWRLYCYLGAHVQNEAILAGLQKNYLIPDDIEVKNKFEIIKTFEEK